MSVKGSLPLLLILFRIHGYLALCLAVLYASCASPFITNFLFISTCLTLSLISLKCWKHSYCIEPDVSTNNREWYLCLCTNSSHVAIEYHLGDVISWHRWSRSDESIPFVLEWNSLASLKCVIFDLSLTLKVTLFWTA